ncbi:hypothetical protein R9C00_02210 [Flammeovirgaceae bacterium SG7u.111]|nr:hypothetical protein [Flammeovirgaceae bacterium SG7u.132]WPO36256.1 hypothetical protein R9C00_02210 [Flammeovirgaceae bacterium SG7u.111]
MANKNKLSFYRTLLVAAFVLAVSIPSFAQETETGSEDFASSFFDDEPKKKVRAPEEGEDMGEYALSSLDSMNVFRTNFGITQVGDQKFFGLRLQPEIALGKLGFGLDIPVQFNMEDGSFRTDEFKDGTGVLRMVRYARYGVKRRDPVYLRAGDLTGVYLGYGSLLNNYTNSVSFDKRKIGLNYDIKIGKLAGIEGMYSDLNLSSFNLMGIRPYVRPFAKMPIPVVRSLEIGGTYMLDKDNTQISSTVDSMQVTYGNAFIKDGMKAWGADLGVTFLKIPFITAMGSIQYSKLLKNESDSLANYFGSLPSEDIIGTPLEDGYQSGTGLSIGVNAKVRFIANIFSLDIGVDRLWYSDHYLPQFFDAVYEMNKDAKVQQLGFAKSMKGIYGNMTFNLLDKVRIGGSLLYPDEISEENPATVRVNAEVVNLFEKLILKGSYIKGNLTSLDDALVLDDRSLATVRAAYRLYKVLVVGVDYHWTFAKVADGSYQLTDHVTPYFGLNIPLNFGGKKSVPEEKE